MRKNKIFLISPREPCGATWLINCFLALGIKTYRSTVEGGMWVRQGRRFVLSPHEVALKKWLPVLSEQESFSFRDDVEVEWAHIWPTGSTAGMKIIYFIRDPRDALLSRYRRESPDVTFRQFLDFPDSQTLLDKIDTWCLFNESWLKQPDLIVCRFEDYKRDARETLQVVLDRIGFVASKDAIGEAVFQSEFERATAAEKRYRETNPQDTQIINRASQVGSWKAPDLENEAAEITERCQGLLSRFGYVADVATATPPSYSPNSSLLGFYRTLRVPSEFWDRPADGREKCRAVAVLELSMGVSVETLDMHRVERYERWQLLSGLDEFVRAAATWQQKRLSQVRARSGALPGVLWRFGQLLASRRIRVPRMIKNAIIYTIGATRAMKSVIRTKGSR